MGILLKTKTYLIGHMQYADGQDWRNQVKSVLEPRGVTCFDPYHKPALNEISEDNETRKKLAEAMENEDYGWVSNHFKMVRAQDLSFCDKSDFIIAHIIPSVASWGTAEELVTSVRMKRPIFLSVEGGKKKTPLWIMGMLPHKYIYNDVNEILETLIKIDEGKIHTDSDRWRLLKPEYR